MFPKKKPNLFFILPLQSNCCLIYSAVKQGENSLLHISHDALSIENMKILKLLELTFFFNRHF